MLIGGPAGVSCPIAWYPVFCGSLTQSIQAAVFTDSNHIDITS